MHATYREILDCIESPESVPRGVRSHVETCSRCAERLAEAREVLGDFGQARLPSPPTDRIARTWERLEALLAGNTEEDARRRAGESLRAALRWSAEATRQVAAVLTGDSLVPAAGLRGPSQAAPRMLRYETDSYRIAVALSAPAAKTYDLRGQVSPLRGASVPAGGWVAADAGEDASEAPLTEFGEFQFRRLPARETDLLIALDDELIQLRVPNPSG